jgi:putative hemolysin
VPHALVTVTTTELLLDAPDPYLTQNRRYHVRLAVSEADVMAAQQLRHEVFSRECGASTPGRVGLDREEFDDRCDHLIVWHQPGTGPQHAVATYRLLPPHSNDAAPRGAGLYADREFGLMPLERLLDSTVEVGRGCVHPGHRSGAVASMLWGGVARYLHLTGYRYLLGSASIDIRDGGANAAAFWDLAVTRYLAPAQRRCRPRDPVLIGGLVRAERPRVPALLRSCLRLGAQVCGPPAFGQMVDTADFLVLLDLETADPGYLRRFLGTGG